MRNTVRVFHRFFNNLAHVFQRGLWRHLFVNSCLLNTGLSVNNLSLNPNTVLIRGGNDIKWKNTGALNSHEGGRHYHSRNLPSASDVGKEFGMIRNIASNRDFNFMTSHITNMPKYTNEISVRRGQFFKVIGLRMRRLNSGWFHRIRPSVTLSVVKKGWKRPRVSGSLFRRREFWIQ